MKKGFVLFFTVCFLALLVSPVTVAADTNIDSFSDEFDFSSVLDTLDNRTKEILTEVGITEISIDSLFSVSPQKIFNALFNIISNAVEKPAKFLLTIFGILILFSVVSSFTENERVLKFLSSSAVALSLAAPIAAVVNTSFSVLQSLMVFTTAFAGVFCSLVSSAGNMTLGVTYGTLTVFSDTVFSNLLVNLSQPVVNAMCSLGFLSCFDLYGFSDKISSIVKKIYVFILSTIGMIFSSLVALKGVLSSSADTLSSRGIRFLIGRSLPVVGGAVSETYLTLAGSLSLIKNTVGVFGIITVVVFIMPNLFELLSWVLVLELSNTASSAFGANGFVGLFKILKDALELLISTIIILTIIFIIGVGIAIAAKGGAL